MPWYAYAMMAVYALSAIGCILMIGQPRKPKTAGAAVIDVTVAALFVWGIVELATA